MSLNFSCFPFLIFVRRLESRFCVFDREGGFVEVELEELDSTVVEDCGLAHFLTSSWTIFLIIDSILVVYLIDSKMQKFNCV